MKNFTREFWEEYKTCLVVSEIDEVIEPGQEIDLEKVINDKLNEAYNIYFKCSGELTEVEFKEEYEKINNKKALLLQENLPEYMEIDQLKSVLLVYNIAKKDLYKKLCNYKNELDNQIKVWNVEFRRFVQENRYFGEVIEYLPHDSIIKIEQIGVNVYRIFSDMGNQKKVLQLISVTQIEQLESNQPYSGFVLVAEIYSSCNSIFLDILCTDIEFSFKVESVEFQDRIV